MSAANATAPAASVEDEARGHEPSMEEILASIRRIIADDDALPGARRRVKEGGETFSAADDSSPPVAEEAPKGRGAYTAPALERREPAPTVEPARRDAREELREENRKPAPAVAELRPLRVTRAEADPLEPDYQPEDAVNDGYGDAPQGPALEAYAESEGEADSYLAVESAAPLVSTDAATSVAAHFQALAASMIMNDSGLLQKYAQEMMRPMLKQWLDDNLPIIVERLVRAEIERVARGGRR